MPRHQPEEQPSGDKSLPDNNADASQHKPLRVWPIPILVALLQVCRVLPQYLEPDLAVILPFFLGPLLAIAFIFVWWLFFSRASWKEGGLGIAGLLLIAAATIALSHSTMIGTGSIFYAFPLGITGFALAAWFLASRPPLERTGLALLVALLCFGFWTLVRLEGVLGNFQAQRIWRWEDSSEEVFLASLKPGNRATPIQNNTSADVGEILWPGFRGPNRAGAAAGVTLSPDWTANPPKQIWRKRVGPGWSSFAMAGPRLFTQEQRGDQEMVVCYEAATGDELWTQSCDQRFWEAMGGVGPRSTPTLADGGLFTLGATGILHRLDPSSGNVVWARNIAEDADRKPPTWGFSSAPLVVGDVVIVHAGAKEGAGLLAYDASNGQPSWQAPAEGLDCYSSPQLATLCGKQCVLMLASNTLEVVDPVTGQTLGTHETKYFGYRVAQPWSIDEETVVLGSPRGTPNERLEFDWQEDHFKITSAWKKRGICPDFNDSVIHAGFAYGFDNAIFACMDIATGDRKWKKGRYGNGQVLLLPDANQLLVISEKGELILLQATPEEHVELAKFQAINGKTWNHPVLVGNHLYVRNAEEAACYELNTQ